MASRAGSPNRNKQSLLTRIQRDFPNYHPIIEMVKVATDTDDAGEYVNTLAERFNANKEVAKYVTPQLKAIEHSGDTGPLEIKIVQFSGNTDTE